MIVKYLSNGFSHLGCPSSLGSKSGVPNCNCLTTPVEDFWGTKVCCVSLLVGAIFDVEAILDGLFFHRQIIYFVITENYNLLKFRRKPEQ
jgi:hypothetical protein